MFVYQMCNQMVKHPYGRFAGLSRPEEQELDLAAGLLSVQGQLAVDLARPLRRLLLHAAHRTTHFDEHCVTWVRTLVQLALKVVHLYSLYWHGTWIFSRGGVVHVHVALYLINLFLKITEGRLQAFIAPAWHYNI